MRLPRIVGAVLVAAWCLGPAQTVSAQDAQAARALKEEIEQLKKDFDARLAALEARLAAVAGGQAAEPARPTAEVPSGAAGAGGPSGTLPVYGNVSAASKV